MCRSSIFGVVLTLAVVLAGSHEAQAQYNSRNSRAIRNATRSFMYNRPTVSPYVNLATPNYGTGLSNYFTLVRPQIEQQEREMVRQRQSAQMQQQINQVQDQVRQSQQEAAGMVLTGRMGWSSRGYPRHGIYLNYYPGFQRIPRGN